MSLTPSLGLIMAARRVLPVQAKKNISKIMPMLTRHHSSQTNGVMQVSSLFWSGSKLFMLPTRSFTQQIATKRSMSQIAEEGAGTHKPSAFQKKIMVWAKMYPSVDKVPERVTRTQLKVSMDKFRIRASLFMVAGTFISAAIIVFIGRKEREEILTKKALERRQS